MSKKKAKFKKVGPKKILDQKVGYLRKEHGKNIFQWSKMWGEICIEEDIYKKRGKRGQYFIGEEWPPKKVRVVVYEE